MEGHSQHKGKHKPLRTYSQPITQKEACKKYAGLTRSFLYYHKDYFTEIPHLPHEDLRTKKYYPEEIEELLHHRRGGYDFPQKNHVY